MGEGGPAGGLLGGKFLLAMFASAAFLVLKELMIIFISFSNLSRDLPIVIFLMFILDAYLSLRAATPLLSNANPTLFLPPDPLITS